MSITAQLELPPGVDLPQTVQEELNSRLLWISKKLADLQDANTAGPVTLVGTRAQRGITNAQNQISGTLWVESDTGLTYVIRSVVAGGKALAWWYLAGTWRGGYSGLPTKLTKFDANLLYSITDKNRTLRWAGANWTFADFESIPAGYITGFRADPGTGWHTCDGSTVAVLNADGTTTNTVLEDFRIGSGTEAYPKWTDAFGGRKAAIKPLITGSTGAGTAHLHAGTGTLATGTIAATATVAALASPTALTISLATNASPTVLTAAGNTLINGQEVVISGAIGNTAINGTFLVAGVSGSNFQLTDLVGVAINGNGAYTANSASVSVAAAGQLHTHPGAAVGGNTATESAHTHPAGTLVNDALGEPKHYELIAFQRV